MYFNILQLLQVQVRLQTQSASNPLYKGTFDCFKFIIKQESVSDLKCSSFLLKNILNTWICTCM